MADFLSSSSPIPMISNAVTTELSPNTSPGASLFQDSTKFLQHLGFLENFSTTPTTTIGGFMNDAPTSSTSNISTLARNSTKTLKCPKCNWHYKYQEALENHLKDKHPDVEVTCIYCIQNLPHPKLARGETYSCGYKPFRCTICNYSTTTKGNLSIHMQSDKHLHAMQDIPTTIVPTSQGGAPQPEQSDDKIYHCLICGTFTTDSMDDLNSHLNSDRSQTNSSDISSLHGIYQCYLCPYTTNLKANFQLHMRTDKHIQRVQMINHMRENVLAATSPTSNLLCRLSNAKTGIQVRCRPCFEILTSTESIVEHCQTSGHLTRTNFMQNTAGIAASVLGFQSDESELAMDLSMESRNGEESNYQCLKCDFQTSEEESAIDHLQDHDFLTSDSPNATLLLIDQIPEEREEIAKLLEMNDARLKCNQCPDFITASTEEFQSHLNNHLIGGEKSTETAESKKLSNDSQTIEVKCPLCDLPTEMSSLNSHLLNDHKITSDVAKKLMATNGIGNENDSSSAPSTSPIYKYHCKLCPMIFRTNDGYQTHSLKHIFTSTHKCTRCNRSFKTVQSLRNHMTNKHEISNFDSTNDISCSICSETFPDRQTLQTHIYSIEHLHKAKKFLEQQSTGKLGQQLNEQVLSLLSKIPKNVTNESSTSTTKKPYKCNVCRLCYGQGSTLDIHLRSVAHQTRIGRLSELVASGEVDASLPVSEQPGGITQKTIGELILPSTTSELEMLQRSESPMDVASTTTASTATPSTQSSSRKRKLDDDAANNPFAAFQNIMNMSQLFGQFSNENSENGSMDFNNALAALNSGDLQSFLSEHLTPQQPTSVHSSPASSPRASPSDETSEEPKTGRSLRYTLELDGLEMIEQFFANIASVKHNIDRIPTSEIPELCKVDCPNCDTVFPSIWILKKHAKDVHAVSLPLEAVQQFSEKLKQALDDLEEENQIPDIKKQKIEEITNSLKAGKLNGTSGNSKSTKKSSLSKIEENSSTSPSMDSSNISNLAMMSMLTGSNFPMLMNPFLSMMNPEMLASAAASQANGSNNCTNGSMTTVSSPGCGGDFSSLTGQQRRARTKITDDQLKVLKTYFDISNSPTEQQVKEMAMKTGLLEKVIKHWFRNTLFKERQRDKDSPYNFNVPPQLSIDLDTYEKTGEAKIKPFKCEDIEDISNVSTPAPSTPIQMPQLEIKREPKIKQEPKLSVSIDPTSAVNSQTAAFVSAASEFMANLNKACNNNFNPFALLSQAAMGGGTPTSNDKSFSDMLASSTSLDLTSPLPSATPNGTGSGGGGGGGGSGRRANRTRFTDIQLRSLQQFFDKQAYPKDDDLEMLSKKLNLSPRVIVVWFQNARQKARKIYENTPNLDNNERFVRTPGQNFQCKRCQLVFPRYYELIQHQQKVCYVNDNDAQQNDNKFVEEMMSDDEKPTTSYDNTSSATVNITTGDPLTIPSGSSHEQISPLPNQSTMETLTQLLNGTTSDVGAEEDKDDSTKDIPMLPGTIATSDDLLKFLTGKCDNATLNKLLESTGKQQQQQNEDFSNDLSQAPLDLSTSPTFLQDELTSNNHSRRESSLNYLDTDFDFSTVMSSVSPTNFPSMLANTFFSSNGSTGSPNQQRSPSATSMSNQHGANKRYRTHLTPLQVYVMKALFNDYKTPSMTECDILGKEIGLNKRVVQVWFQNARAKERKCRSVTGDEDLPKTNNDNCSMCGIDFNSRTPKLTMQDHIFTKRHIGFLSERFNSRSTSQSSNPGRHDGSLSPAPQIPDAPLERVRAKAVRDSGSRKPSSNNQRPSSTNSQFPFNLMYGLQSGTLPHLMCDPSILGTPIAALQIPQAVMQQIQVDIQAGKDSTKFTQDGLDLKDLKAKISDDDFKCVTTVTNEVGYACPGCSYTFQQQAQLEAHQKIICQNFEGKVFKLLQIHYECIACNTKTGTQDDFRKHIESQTHQQIRNLFIQPVIENFLTSSAM